MISPARNRAHVEDDMTRQEAAAQVHPCGQTGIGRCNGKGWHRYTYHHTGIMWAEEYRPKYPTKREAVEAVLAAARDHDAAEGGHHAQ